MKKLELAQTVEGPLMAYLLKTRTTRQNSAKHYSSEHEFFHDNPKQD